MSWMLMLHRRYCAAMTQTAFPSSKALLRSVCALPDLQFEPPSPALASLLTAALLQCLLFLPALASQATCIGSYAHHEHNRPVQQLACNLTTPHSSGKEVVQ